MAFGRSKAVCMRWPDHLHHSQKKVVSAFVMHHRAQKFSPKEKKYPVCALAMVTCCRPIASSSMVMLPRSPRACSVGDSNAQHLDYPPASAPCPRSLGACMRAPKAFRWIDTMYFFRRTMRVNSAIFLLIHDCRKHPPSTCVRKIVAVTRLHQSAIACWCSSTPPPKAAARLLNRRLMHAKPIPFPCWPVTA